jgi:ABC-type transport system involved in multi-copper enzyme maturation permease subunit
VSSFGGALQSEVTKITSTRLWWILAIIMAAYIAVCAGGAAALFGALGDSTNGPTIPGEMLAPLVYSFGPTLGYVFAVLLGALATTNEFRHQTLTPTFLATPRRGRVLVAKLIALIGAGALYGVIAMIAAVGAGAGLLLAFGIDPQLGDPDTWVLIGRSVLAMALWSAIGVGLGVLVPSQVAAIVIVLAFTQFVEPILRLASGIADWTAQIGQFLPGAASDALVGASFFALAGGGSGVALEWWQGGLVLLAIAVVVSILGWLTTWRRDVT